MSVESLPGPRLLGRATLLYHGSLSLREDASAATLASSGLVTFSADLAVPFAAAACLGIVSWFAVLAAPMAAQKEQP